MFEEIFKNSEANGDIQNVDTPKFKVVLSSFPLRFKTTMNGVKITLKGNTVIKDYSKNYRVMLTFSTKKQAIKEFNRHRKSHKEL